MTRLKGKVKSRQMQTSPKPLQVIWNGVIYPFIRRDLFGYYIARNADDNNWIKVQNIQECKELWVMWWEERNVPGIPGTASRIIPLKYSQWQVAIDNDEVDSDKEVEFELIGKVEQNSQGTFVKTDTKIAKIIPAKKKLYTEDEVLKLCLKAFEMGEKGAEFSSFQYAYLK